MEVVRAKGIRFLLGPSSLTISIFDKLGPIPKICLRCGAKWHLIFYTQ